MDAERQRQIVRILKSVLDLAPGERRSYLEKACNGDEMLQREVESILVANDQESDFLEAGAVEDAARMLAEAKASQDTLILNSQPAGQSNDTPLRIAPGVILDGRYRIVRELGSGGIGIVYLAEDQKLHGKQVVIKVLQERLGESDHREWFEKKFRDEINALEQIDHPNVVSALDVGLLPDGRSFLVMQHVSGVTLRAAIPPQGMELSRVGKLVYQISQGLSAAHEKGVIHRDLKPENIMLQTVGGEEYIKLIDFGMATVREAISEATSETTKVAGTIRYMSPEQLKGRPVLASDIYALGVITYELITGRQPFDADSHVELYEKQQAGDLIKPGDLRTNLPAGLQDVVLKALSFNASDRYASARGFSEAFNQALAKPRKPDPYETEEPIIILPTNKPPPRIRLWLMLASILIVTVVGTMSWPYFSQKTAVKTDPSSKGTTPELTKPSPQPTAEERSLSCSISMLKNPKRHLDCKQFSALDELIVKSGDEMDFILSSPQSGYLYVINQSPTQKLYMLFPRRRTNNTSAKVAAGQAIEIPVYFDNEVGEEKFWLIWSENMVAELEAVKYHANDHDKGWIYDSSEIKSVIEYLAKYPELSSEKGEADKQSRFKRQADVLIGSVKIQHR